MLSKARAKFNRFIPGTFTKNVVILSGGTAFSQAINLLFAPVITRLYTPEEYGILTLYTSILGMLAIAAALRYEFGIPIAGDAEKTVNVIALSAAVVTMFSLSAALVLFWGGDRLLGLLEARLLLRYRWLIPAGIFLAGIYSVFFQWALREKKFKEITGTKLGQGIMQNAVTVGAGLAGMGAAGLIIGRIVGQSAGITTLGRSFLKKSSHLLKKISLREMIWCARRYKDFPLYGAPGQILNIVGVQLPVLLITAFYGPETVGFYGLAGSIVSLPMDLIGVSVGDVFYAEAARIGKTHPRELQDLSLKLIKNLMIIGLPPLLILLFLGPSLFAWVFGDAWRQAGTYAQIISVLLFFRFIFTPVSRLFSVFERQREALLLDVLRVALVLIVFGCARRFSLSPYGAVMIYTGVMSIVYAVTFWVAQRLIPRK